MQRGSDTRRPFMEGYVRRAGQPEPHAHEGRRERKAGEPHRNRTCEGEHRSQAVRLPDLKKIRDVAEHVDDYALDQGRQRAVADNRRKCRQWRLNARRCPDSRQG